MVKFIASIPATKSAIQIDGMGDGGTVKLEVSRAFLNELVKLSSFTQTNLEVSITPIEL